MDIQSHTRMQILANEARRVDCVFHKGGNCVLLPLQAGMDYQRFIEWASNQGFEWIGVVALMREDTPGGEPIVQHEVVPGVSEEMLQRLRTLFIEDLAADTAAGLAASQIVA